MEEAESASGYDTLTRSQLTALLRKRDMDRRLGLVWERGEIDADQAIDRNFVLADLITDQCARPAPWDNFIIEGDNYDALRWLRMTHRGRVKCIYVDPPYNTGNKDWVYNDDYVDPTHRFRNSQWLEFLFRRFELARDLLAPDGVLLCSINDTNRAVLELMMDQALPGMRLGSMAWRTRTGSNTDQGFFMSQDHEHVLVYGNVGFEFAGTEKSFSMYRFDDDDGKGPWRKDNLTLGFSYLERPNLYYPLFSPETGVHFPANPNAVWRYASKKVSGENANIQTRFMEEWIEAGQILFPENKRVETFETKADLLAAIRSGDVPTSGRAPLLREDLPDLDFWIGKKIGWGTPAFKRYKKDLKNQTQPLSSWITPNSESGTVPDDANMIVSGTNDEGAKVIKSVFGSKAFNYAKPVSLVRELIRQSTGPGDIVLDFFARSATTAQAVMELNAEDGLDRRFVMVSSTEATVNEPEKNLCRDVTAERVRRLNANDEQYDALSAGFAYLRCREVAPLLLDDMLCPASAWAVLEVRHGLPLTVWRGGDDYAVHEAELTTLVLIDRWSVTAKAEVDALLARGRPLHLYAFSPGQIDGLDPDAEVEIHGVRETLERLFSA